MTTSNSTELALVAPKTYPRVVKNYLAKPKAGLSPVVSEQKIDSKSLVDQEAGWFGLFGVTAIASGIGIWLDVTGLEYLAHNPFTVGTFFSFFWSVLLTISPVPAAIPFYIRARVLLFAKKESDKRLIEWVNANYPVKMVKVTSGELESSFTHFLSTKRGRVRLLSDEMEEYFLASNGASEDAFMLLSTEGKQLFSQIDKKIQKAAEQQKFVEKKGLSTFERQHSFLIKGIIQQIQVLENEPLEVEQQHAVDRAQEILSEVLRLGKQLETVTSVSRKRQFADLLKTLNAIKANLDTVVNDYDAQLEQKASTLASYAESFVPRKGLELN